MTDPNPGRPLCFWIFFETHADAPNGFNALSVYDTNANGMIDPGDAVWDSLRIWVDLNHDGICTRDEMFTLEQAGINSISLKYHPDGYVDAYRNQFRLEGTINSLEQDRVDKRIYDVFFATDSDRRHTGFLDAP